MKLVVFSGSQLTQVVVQWSTLLILETPQMTLLALRKISRAEVIAQVIMIMLPR